MGCGASFVYSGVKTTQHRNPDVRINIIEATSILDYEDTDSSCRQTPVISRQTPVLEHPKISHVFHKKVPDNSTPGVVIPPQQELPPSQVSSFDRPSSPVPTTVRIVQTLHRIHTDNTVNEEVVPLVL